MRSRTMKALGIITSLVVVAGLALLSSCNNPSTSTYPGSWDKIGSFAGTPRQGAVSFVINNVAYVGLGYNGSNNISTAFLTDFWKYDPTADAWYQEASFPGLGRRDAIAFVINNVAYVGTGYSIINGINNPFSDVYEFTPSGSFQTNGKWTRVADFGFSVARADTTVSARYGCGAFAINNRGFVGWGNDANSFDYKDLWEFQPAVNAPKSPYPGSWIVRPGAGSKRAYPFIFVIDNYVYVGGGYDQAGGATYPTDLIKFDITQIDTSPWTYMNGLTGKDKNGNAITQPRTRQQSSTFTINGMGYLTMGSAGSGDCWQYNPTNDTWTQYYSITSNTPIVGTSRSNAVGFAVTVNSKVLGILATGGNGTISYDDVWRFDPTGSEPDYK